MVDEPLGRGRGRDRAVLRTLFGGAGLQLAIAAATLAALPFVTRHLTAVEFGVFTTLTGFAVLLSFADLGIGGSLTTRLAELRGVGDGDGARAVVSTSVVASGAIGLVVALVLALSAVLAPWREILGAEQLADDDVVLAVLAAAVATGASVPALVGQRLLYGIGRGAQSNLLLAIGAVAGAGLLIVGSSVEWPLYAFVLTALGVPVSAGIASGVAAVRADPGLMPRVASASIGEWRLLRRATGWHFAVGLAGAISFQTDVLVVAGVLGAASAGVYAVCTRVFALVAQSLTPAMLQMWPAFTDAHIRGDRDWIKSRLMWATLVAGGVSVAAGAVIVAFGPQFIRAVLTDELVPDRSLLIALAAWTTYSLISAPAFFLMNATGRVRTHALTAVAVAVVNVPTSIVLTQEIGIAGPAWGSLIAHFMFSAPVGVIAVRRILSEPGPRLSQ